MDPRRPEIRGEMGGCKNLAAILACIVFLFFAALLIVGWIAITDAVTFAENTGVAK